MTDESVTVAIDSPARLRAVASLAQLDNGYPSAVEAIKKLALAVGCEVCGGRIYEPAAWHYERRRAVSRGWKDFVFDLSWNNVSSRLRDAMVARAVAEQVTVTINAELAESIRARATNRQDSPPAPKKRDTAADTAAATAATIRRGQETQARKLRAAGWLPIPPEIMKDLHGQPAEYVAAAIAKEWERTTSA